MQTLGRCYSVLGLAGGSCDIFVGDWEGIYLLFRKFLESDSWIFDAANHPIRVGSHGSGSWQGTGIGLVG